MPRPKAMPRTREARNRYTKSARMDSVDDSVTLLALLYVCG